MSFARRRSKPRPIYKSLLDALVFIAALAMIALALRQSGLLTPETGQFIAVDGDSLRKGDQDYRLHGIDAPELHQTCTNSSDADYPCGQDARRALAALIRGKTLSCGTRDTDRYGRFVTTCKAGDLDIAAEMARLGWALAYVRHSASYMDEEAEARRARRGIWQGDFENPEDWRAANRRGMLQGTMLPSEAMPD